MRASRGLRVVRDHQDELAEARIQIAQQAENRFRVFGIEVAGGSSASRMAGD